MPDTLTKFRTDGGGEVNVIGGPRPYLWVGNPDGTHAATVEGDLRALRDAITAALRHADPSPAGRRQ